MVSADNLNLDVLELVFAHLASGNDLTSVALVSRSFFAGVIPKLYERITFRLREAKRYPLLTAPFAAILAREELAVHVKSIDIQAVPILKSPTSVLHPTFLRDCSQTLKLCTNLTSFTCVCPVLPPFLLSLQNKTRLRDLRIHAKLTTEQAQELVAISGLRSITLDNASWNVIDLLPRWIGLNAQHLTALTLFNANDLNETILESGLSQLPRLLALHVIGCLRLDHSSILRCIAHTPLLESLSFTTYVNSSPRSSCSPPAPRLLHLRHLSLDSRPTLVTGDNTPTSTSLLSRILTSILIPSNPPLRSLSVRLSDRALNIPEPWLGDVLNAFGGTLRTLSFRNCAVTLESVRRIARRCTALERLEVPITSKDMRPFTFALAESTTVQNLVDLSDPHATHSAKVAFTKNDIRFMMITISSVKTIECDGRIWTRRESNYGVQLSLQKRQIVPSEHWFLPGLSEELV